MQTEENLTDGSLETNARQQYLKTLSKEGWIMGIVAAVGLSFMGVLAMNYFPTASDQLISEQTACVKAKLLASLKAEPQGIIRLADIKYKNGECSTEATIRKLDETNPGTVSDTVSVHAHQLQLLQPKS